MNYTLEFLKKDESEICLNFRKIQVILKFNKIQGSSVDFYNLIEKIKNLLGLPQNL